MKLSRWLELGLGAYIAAPGIEDFASGGTTIAPSFIVGIGMVADALGWKI